MSRAPGPQRLWGNAYQLFDLLDQSPGGQKLAARDFALLTLAAHLSYRFPRQLVFKGGFVLRHVHGILRFSRDVDATRHDPAHQKLAAVDVAETIRQASIGDSIRFYPQVPPKTDSAQSLDFDHVKVTGSLLPESVVQVEISYREAIVDQPDVICIGGPFYEDFEILSMTVPEMAAEKLRAIAQRIRPTDLADLAEMLVTHEVRDDDTARLALTKFELVKQGVVNRSERIERNLREMSAEYDNVVQALFPDARRYGEAMEIVWPRVKALIP